MAQHWRTNSFAMVGDLTLLGRMEDWFPDNARKKKKVDMEALQSALKRIPGMDIATVRDLLDIGIRDVDELRGRSPEALYADIVAAGRQSVPPERLQYLRMAVYYAEAEEPDPRLMEPWHWTGPGMPG